MFNELGNKISGKTQQPAYCWLLCFEYVYVIFYIGKLSYSTHQI